MEDSLRAHGEDRTKTGVIGCDLQSGVDVFGFFVNRFRITRV